VGAVEHQPDIVVAGDCRYPEQGLAVRPAMSFLQHPLMGKKRWASHEEQRERRHADIGVSAFSLFFMGCPSFLAHQRVLEEGHGRSNCETLFGISAIPSDNYIRLMLDGAD